MDLLVLSGFTAFIYAILLPAITFLERKGIRLLRAIVSLAVSSVGAYLLQVQHAPVVAVAGAFFGVVSVAVLERLTESAPTIVRAVGQD